MLNTGNRLYHSYIVCLALFGCSDQQTQSIDANPNTAGDRAAIVSTIPPATEIGPPPELRSNPGSFQSRTDISEAELGVPIYPGARPLTGGTWDMTDSMSEGAELITSVRLATTDPIEEVTAFYLSKLKPEPFQFEFQTTAGRNISLTTENKTHASSNVMLRQHHTGTRIEISVMGPRKKNDT